MHCACWLGSPRKCPFLASSSHFKYNYFLFTQKKKKKGGAITSYFVPSTSMRRALRLRMSQKPFRFWVLLKKRRMIEAKVQFWKYCSNSNFSLYQKSHLEMLFTVSKSCIPNALKVLLKNSIKNVTFKSFKWWCFQCIKSDVPNALKALHNSKFSKKLLTH